MIKKEESKKEVQKLKSVIPVKSRIIDNKCPENVEILRGKDDLEGELKPVSE